MLKIRRPLGRLIFNMGIAIPGKTVFLIETAPRKFFTNTKKHCAYTCNKHSIWRLYFIRKNSVKYELRYEDVYSRKCISNDAFIMQSQHQCLTACCDIFWILRQKPFSTIPRHSYAITYFQWDWLTAFYKKKGRPINLRFIVCSCHFCGMVKCAIIRLVPFDK